MINEYFEPDNILHSKKAPARSYTTHLPLQKTIIPYFTLQDLLAKKIAAFLIIVITPYFRRIHSEKNAF
jgi:hypothetical protein